MASWGGGRREERLERGKRVGNCTGGFLAISVGVDGGVKVGVDGTGKCEGGKGTSCGGVVGGEGVPVCCCHSGVAVMRVVGGDRDLVVLPLWWSGRGFFVIVGLLLHPDCCEEEGGVGV